MATTQRPRAILKIKRKNTNSVETRAKALVAGAGGNPTVYASVTATITAIENQLPLLDKAEVQARAKAPGAAAARNVQRNLLIGLMETAVGLVQTIADACSTVDQAVSTIQEAGLLVALVPQRTKAILAAKQATPGSNVTLEANATVLGGSSRKKSCFNWQITSDGGKTYVTLPSTPTAKTSVAGLTPLLTYGFRVSVTSSSGAAGAWSQTVAFLVH
jgi:hypothetical protein